MGIEFSANACRSLVGLHILLDCKPQSRGKSDPRRVWSPGPWSEDPELMPKRSDVPGMIGGMWALKHVPSDVAVPRWGWRAVWISSQNRDMLQSMQDGAKMERGEESAANLGVRICGVE